MVQGIRAQTSEITYFGPGVFSAFLHAVATELQHLYFKLFTVEQRLDLMSAEGAALDSYGATRGLPRLAGSAASVILDLLAPSVVTGTGTITVSAGSVTGTDTEFLSELAEGDTLLVDDLEFTVSGTPASDTACTVTGVGTVASPTAFEIRKFQVEVLFTTPGPLQVTTASGVVFEVAEECTLEQTYAGSDTLRGRAIAVSTATGASQNVPARTIRETVSTSGIVDQVTLSVSNAAAAQGGTDAEADATYRARIVTALSAVNHGTKLFYESQVRAINSDVSRVLVGRGDALNEVVLRCATRSGAPLTAPEKTEIVTALYELVPVHTQVSVQDMTYVEIDVEFSTTLLSGYTLTEVTADIADQLADFLNWTVWPFETAVQADDLLQLCSATDGVDSLRVSSFLPATDTALEPGELPRVGSISITDLSSGESLTVTDISTQYPRLS